MKISSDFCDHNDNAFRIVLSSDEDCFYVYSFALCHSSALALFLDKNFSLQAYYLFVFSRLFFTTFSDSNIYFYLKKPTSVNY